MSERRGDDGFTLVELLLAIAILAIIAIPLSMGFITGLRFIGRSDEKFNDSRSALLSAAYFAGDVSSANAIVLNDASACGGGSAIVSFDSSSASGGVGAPVSNKVSYVVDTSDPASTRLVRTSCINAAAATQSVAAVALGSTPAITCYDAGNVVNASCVGARRVKMLVTQAANTPSPDVPSPTPYTFTLEGTRRSQ
jgi:prepilin-type N-terminal cleavage/methylation domain-containing protein